MNIQLRMAFTGLLLVTLVAAPASAAQTMPGKVYHALAGDGHEDLAEEIQHELNMREDPDRGDVTSLIERWETEAGGPSSGYDWVTVARLWTRAGHAAEAEMALHTAEDAGGVPAAVLLLDQARIAFLSGDAQLGEEAYWGGCEVADAAAAQQYWLDVEVLATPEELNEWDRFRRLPASQTDLCGFLEAFWAERVLASTMNLGRRISQHYERVRYAQSNYRRRSGKKIPSFSTDLGRPRNAAYDDRGLLYIRMGAPDRSTRFAGNTGINSEMVSAECFQPNVSWAYDYPGGTKVYHFTTFSGTDDYWLIENLGQVYRCGAPEASGRFRLTPVNQHRAVQLGAAAGLVLQDLYRSRQGLDPLYAQAAQRMADPERGGRLNSRGTEALESQGVLQTERERTFADAKFAITEVPERPEIRADSRLMVETLQFRSSQSGLNRVWLNALLEGDKLTPRRESGSFTYQIHARLVLLDETGEYSRHEASFTATAPMRLQRDQSLPVRIPIDVPAGTYRYTLLVRDALSDPAAPRSGNYQRGEVTVRDLSGDLPVLSDVAVAPDSGGSWTPLGPTGLDIGLLPSPSHRSGADGIAYVYFEAYNLTPGGPYETRIRFEPEGDDGESFDLSFSGEVPLDGQPRTRRMLRLELADTTPGVYRMSVTVTDETTGRSTLAHATSIVVADSR